MRDDIERWEKKYSAAEPGLFDAPDKTLQSLGDWFDGNGEALDIACGGGANLQWLCQQGYAVTGMDGSLNALKLACRQPDGKKFRLIAADMDRTDLPVKKYAAIVVVHYLNREIFPMIMKALKPGGRLLYKTFNKNLLVERPGFNPDYVLEIGELAGSFNGLRPRIIAEPDAENPADSWILMENPGGNNA